MMMDEGVIMFYCAHTPPHTQKKHTLSNTLTPLSPEEAMMQLPVSTAEPPIWTGQEVIRGAPPLASLK